MNTKSIAIAAALVIAVGVLGYTQFPKTGHDAMPGMDMASADASASSKAYEAAMASMMKGMMVPYTGDADVGFHQGHDAPPPGRHRHGESGAAICQGPGGVETRPGCDHRPGKRDCVHERLACQEWKIADPGMTLFVPCGLVL